MSESSRSVIHSDRERRSYSILVVLALLPAAAFWYTTPWGAGVTIDSIRYFGMAEILLEDQAIAQMGNHFPPGYPWFIAQIARLTGDLHLAVRYSQTALIFASCLLVLALVRDGDDRGLVIGGLVALVLLLRTDTFVVWHYAWSEPLFAFLMLATLALFLSGLKRCSVRLLFASGLLGGFAILVRYSGLPFVASCSLLIPLLLYRRGPQRAAVALFSYLAGWLIPTIAWVAFAQYSNFGEAPRALGFHPPSIETLGAGVGLVWDWFSHGRGALAGMLSLILLVSLSVRFLRVASGPPKRLLLVLIVMSAAYFAFLLATLIFFDAYLEMQQRMLFPVFLLYVIGCGTICAVVWCESGIAYRMIAVAFLGMLALGTVDQSWEIAKKRVLLGDGFANRYYRSLAVWRSTESLSDYRLVSNGPELLKLHAGLDAVSLPRFYSAVSLASNAGYGEEMTALVEEVLAGEAAIVYFRSMGWRKYLPGFSEITGRLGLDEMTLDQETYIFRKDR